MPEYFKNVTDSMKFLIMLVIYTGYMTWWASGISHGLIEVKEDIQAHVGAKDHPQYQTQAIITLQASTIKMAGILEDNIVQHTKCTVIMENILRRLEIVERNRNSWED